MIYLLLREVHFPSSNHQVTVWETENHVLPKLPNRKSKDEVMRNFEEGLSSLLCGLELWRRVKMLHVVLECLTLCVKSRAVREKSCLPGSPSSFRGNDSWKAPRFQL